MKRGSRGDHVKVLQQLLNDADQGHPALALDGIFGPATEAAVRMFQDSQGMVATGEADKHTLSLLRSWDVIPRSIRDSDITDAAYRLQADSAAIQAIVAVESRGRGFLPSGRPTILFERHIMRRRLVHRNWPLQDLDPQIVNASPGGYRGGEREWDRIEQAMAIHRDAAIESASWGLFQVMGFHWERLGYLSAEQWRERMARSEWDHLDAFVRFMQADPVLLQALRDHRWAAVARRYNGPNYHINRYDERLASEHATAQRSRRA
jgi:hypothetical protein